MSILLYLFKTIAIQAIALLGYRWLLDKEPWGHLKRFYLLGSLVLSFLIPLLPSGVTVLTPGELVPDPTLLPVVDVPALEVTAAPSSLIASLSFWQLLLCVGYALGVAYGLGQLIRFLYAIRLRLAQADSISPGPIRLVALPTPVATHTFWRWVFYGGREAPAPEILTHEYAHARQLHSFDRLLVALLRSFCWFNPVLLWYDRAILENHEYLADRAVLQAGWDRTTYQQRLLLALQSINGVPPLSSGAGFALTKKRFQMMYTSSGHWSVRLTKIAVAGLIWALLLLGFGERGVAQVPPPPPTAAPAAPQPPLQIRHNKQAIPTRKQLEDWASTDFEVIIDNKKVKTASLKARQPKEFSHYYRTVRRDEAGQLLDVIILFTEAAYPWPDVPLPPPPPPPVAPAPPAPPAPPAATPTPPPPPPAPLTIDWSTVDAKVPTTSQWKSWQAPATYGIWIDGQRVSNSHLQAYGPTDFSYFTVSKLHKNAVNYGKHTHQVNLISKERFKELQTQE